MYDQRLMDDTLMKLTWEGLQKNVVKNDDTMIDKRTGLGLIPNVSLKFTIFFRLLQYFVKFSV